MKGIKHARRAGPTAWARLPPTHSRMEPNGWLVARALSPEIFDGNEASFGDHHQTRPFLVQTVFIFVI